MIVLKTLMKVESSEVMSLSKGRTGLRGSEKRDSSKITFLRNLYFIFDKYQEAKNQTLAMETHIKRIKEVYLRFL